MRLFVGNLISLGAAFFLCASSLARERRRVYLLLCGESLLLAAAQAVFIMPIGVAVQLVAAVRNLLVACGRFHGREAILFSFLTLFFGLAADPALLFSGSFSPRLVFALLPVAAGIQLTLTAYFSRTLRGARLGVLSNAVLWTVYSLSISDAVTAASGICVLLLNLAYFLKRRLKKGEKDIENRQNSP